VHEKIKFKTRPEQVKLKCLKIRHNYVCTALLSLLVFKPYREDGVMHRCYAQNCARI